MIAIRTDANQVIGAGHLMRCLSIAAELKMIGEEVILITADEYPKFLIAQAGIKQLTLHTDWRLLPHEADLLLPILKHLHVTLLLVDSYLATPEFIGHLKKGCIAVAYIDDLLSNVYPADILINYNITGSRAKYEELYGKRKTVLLLDTKYAPLRPEFRCVKPFPIHQDIRRVFLSAGGADPYGFTAALTERLFQEKDFDSVYLIATPGFFGHNDRLLKLQHSFPRLKLVENPNAVKKNMEACDVAISAAGSTLYELCALGVPTISFSLADNQVAARKAFGAQKIMVECGDIRDGISQCLDKIIQSLVLLKCPEKRAFFSKKAFSITDGLGALRIAAVLSDISHKHRLSDN